MLYEKSFDYNEHDEYILRSIIKGESTFHPNCQFKVSKSKADVFTLVTRGFNSDLSIMVTAMVIDDKLIVGSRDVNNFVVDHVHYTLQNKIEVGDNSFINFKGIKGFSVFSNELAPELIMPSKNIIFTFPNGDSPIVFKIINEEGILNIYSSKEDAVLEIELV